jgi:hypothetical protein
MSPATITDRAQEWRVWRTPGVFVIAFYVEPPADRQGFMAAVSYGTQPLSNSFTGTANSAWKYTTSASMATSGWDFSTTFNDSLWLTADESVRCSTGFPVASLEGYNFSSFVSNVGQRDIRTGQAIKNPQPDTTAYWVADGKRCNQLVSQVVTRVYYRLVVNLTELAQSCFGRDDPRFDLQANVGGRETEQWFKPLTKNATSPLHIRAVGREAVTTWFDGRFVPNHVPFTATSFMNFIVDPDKEYLLAFWVRVPQPYSTTGFLASVSLDDRLIAMTGSGEWKVWPSNDVPKEGWDTDLNFDEEGWQLLNERYVCPDTWLNSFWRERTSPFQQCRPDMVSFPTCNTAERLSHLYIRLKLNLKGTNTPTHPCFSGAKFAASLTKQVFVTSTKTIGGFATITENVFLENAVATVTTTSTSYQVELLTVTDTVSERLVETDYTRITNAFTYEATQTACPASNQTMGASSLGSIGGSNGLTIIVGAAGGVFVALVATLMAIVSIRRQTRAAKQWNYTNFTAMGVRSMYQTSSMPPNAARSFSTMSRSMGNLPMTPGIFHTVQPVPPVPTQ